MSFYKKIFFSFLILGGLSPFLAYASHTSQVETKSLAAFRNFALCDTDPNGITDGTASDSATFSDGPYRLLHSVHSGGNVERDDTWKAFLSVNGSTPQELYSYGNCRCTNDPEKGCPGTDNVWWLPMFQDSGAQSFDTVTLTGSAGNKARNTQAGFQGYQAIANYRLCDEKQVANNGACRTITGSIFSDKTVCGAPCSPRISWNSGSVLTGAGVAENVIVKKNGSTWQSGPNGSASDSGLSEGDYTFILYGTASDGNNGPKEFELGRIAVTVKNFFLPDCNGTSAVKDLPVTLQASEGSPSDGYSWSAPEASPSTGNGSSFTTTYNTLGLKTVTVSSAGQSGTCTVNVVSDIGVDIKANNSDGPYTLPDDLYNFTLSWGPKAGMAGDYSNCTASGNWSGSRNPVGSEVISITKGNATEFKTYSISCTTTLGTPISDSVTVVVQPPKGSCSLSASSQSINVNNSVSFTVSSFPSGHNYIWQGDDSGVQITALGTGPTQNTETYTVTKAGSYTRKAIVHLPNGDCATDPLTVNVSDTSDGGGGSGGTGGTKSVDIKVKGVNDADYKNSTTVPYGTSVSISWTSNNVTSCEADTSPNGQGFVGLKSTSGSQTSVALTTHTDFIMHCTGPNGQVEDTAPVSVSPPLIPAVDLKIGDQTRGPVLVLLGTELNWSAYNVTSCLASASPSNSEWSGSVPAVVSGSKIIHKMGIDTTFILECIGVEGRASDSIVADVNTPNLGGGTLEAATGRFQDVLDTSSCDDEESHTAQQRCLSSLKPERKWVRTSSWLDPLNAGFAPANDVGLRFGANYRFRSSFSGVRIQFDCTNDGTFEATVPINTAPNQNYVTIAEGICDYSNPGTYTAYTRAIDGNGRFLRNDCNAPSGYVGTASCDDAATIIVAPPLIPPTIAITGPGTVPHNTSAIISWITTDATSCSASASPANFNWSGSKDTSGSQNSGNLITTTNFSLTCSGPGGTASGSTIVNVTPPPAPTVILSGPLSVAHNTSALLTWSSKNATSCTASASPANSNWIGSRSLSGSQSSGNLTQNITFTLSCSGTGGTASQNLNVTVGQPPPGVLTVDITASNGKLDWSSTGATSCSASAIPANFNWIGSKPTSGSQSFGSVVTATTFTISCSGPGGSGSDSVTVAGSPPPLIPDFGLNKSGDIFATIIGTQAVTSSSANISVSRFDGFSDNVNLSVQSISPALSGARYNFSDSSLGSGEFARGSSFSVTVPQNTPPGVYTITLRGVDGGLVRNVNVRLNVNTKDPSFREI